MRPVSLSALSALLPGLCLAVGHPGARLPWSGATRSLLIGRAATSRLNCGLLQHTRSQSSGPWQGGETRNWGFRPGSALGLCSAICGLGYICGGSEPGGVATALSAAALLNGALLAHEAGHLVAARALGVAVREFSVGVGPRVAWWQGATTTYSLRALPLFGYVSFLIVSQLAQAATTPAAAAAIGGAGGAAVHLPYSASAAGVGAAAGRRPLLLLEWLPPGRRALVVAAGVVANAMLAGAFVAWQVMSHGELGVLVRPGAKIRRAEGWEGPGEAPAAAAAALQPHHDHQHRHQDQHQLDQQQQQHHSDLGLQQAQPQRQQGPAAPVLPPERRLRAGDVVLRVGDRDLPAGGDMEKVFVEALHAAAATVAAAKTSVAVILARTHGGGGGGDVGEDTARPAIGVVETADRAVESLAGVQMMVLRAEGGSSSDGSGGGGRIVSVDAADVLRYETLVVSPNYVAGYKPPRDGWEAAAMVGRELASWTSLVLQSWSDALAAAVAGSSTSDAGAASSSSSSSGGGSQMVGPLGLVASAAAIAVAADREARTVAAESGHRQHCATASGDHAAAAAATAVAGAGGAGAGNLQQRDQAAGLASAGGLYDNVGAVRHPPPLLSMGVQVNVQLALINLLPLPVLDGGQLVLLALEAARGGRRLPPSLERAALLVSGLAVGCWVLALSLKDVVGLADTAAYRLAAAVQPPTANRHNGRLTAAGGEVSMGPTSLAGRRLPVGHYASETDLGADFDAAAAAGSWAT